MTRESQKILKPRLRGLDPTEYVFKPAEATKIINTRIRDKYDHNSFCRAVKRGCKRAIVDVFVPYDLRRTTTTDTRAILGKEAAKVLLGHTKTDTTDIYLLEEVQEAIKVAKLLASSVSAAAPSAHNGSDHIDISDPSSMPRKPRIHAIADWKLPYFDKWSSADRYTRPANAR